jgi:hypothetical protein
VVNVRSACDERAVGDHSFQASLQRSFQEAKDSPYSAETVWKDGQYQQIPTSPILADDPLPLLTARVSSHDVATLRDALTDRDLAILVALTRYRYLDTRQLRLLFFPSERTAQMKLQDLRQLGLVRRWKVFLPNFYRLPSIFLISPRGAALTARAMDREPGVLIELAHTAAEKPSKYWRTVQSNWFFIRLALAAAKRTGSGLCCWSGATDFRYGISVGDESADRPIPDGAGRLVLPDGEVVFDLDWLRAGLPRHWLARRVRAYVDHFMLRRSAPRHHVLFVAREERGEKELLTVVRRVHGMFLNNCQRSWVTTKERLVQEGPLGPIWKYASTFWKEPDGWEGPAPAERLRIDQLPKVKRGDVDLRRCIGRPQWWRWQ